MVLTPGTIAILTHDTGRWSAFWESALALWFPQGTKLMTLYGLDLAKNRNTVLAQATGDWVWFLDDDHTFPKDTLARLLAREVDVVQPVVVRRYTPFLPVAQREETQPDGTRRLMGQTLEDLGREGVVAVDAVGMGGTLIRRRVWEGMAAPWFRVGELTGETLSEDIGFCQRARQAGFQCYVDLDVPIGHLAAVTITPIWDTGRWRVGLRVGNLEVLVPGVRRPPLDNPA